MQEWIECVRGGGVPAGRCPQPATQIVLLARSGGRSYGLIASAASANGAELLNYTYYNTSLHHLLLPFVSLLLVRYY